MQFWLGNIMAWLDVVSKSTSDHGLGENKYSLKVRGPLCYLTIVNKMFMYFMQDVKTKFHMPLLFIMNQPVRR